MNIVAGQEVRCDYCKYSFFLEDLSDLQPGIKDGTIKIYLKCPKCGQKNWSDGNITIKIDGRGIIEHEPKSEFEANLEADAKFDKWF